MREILFRGKRTDNGEWVYGYYVKYETTNETHHIIVPKYASTLYGIEVDPDTVGQYTGLPDRNKKSIFENDIVKQTAEFIGSDPDSDFYNATCSCYRETIGTVAIYPSKGAVMKNRTILTEEWSGETVKENERIKGACNICAGRCEVIGNIYDNPELMEE